MTVRGGAWTRWLRWTRWIWVIGFAEGTLVHAWDLLQGGLHAFHGAPPVIQVWFHSLLLLDPLVVLLLLRRAPAAAPLGAVVMFGDMVGNWRTNWDDVLRHPAAYVGLIGLPAITEFGLFVLATAVPLHRALVRSRC